MQFTSRLLFIATLSIFTMLAACTSVEDGNGRPPCDEETFTLTGRAETIFGDPLRGVGVLCLPCPTGRNAQRAEISSITDGNGCFTMSGLAPGRHTLTADPACSEAGSVEFTLNGRGDWSPGEIVLAVVPRPVIMGQVVDEEGERLSKASIFVEYRHDARSVRSERSMDVREDGTFVTGEFPLEGTARLMAWAPGYRSLIVERVPLGENGLILTLSKGGAVGGQVLSAPNKEPITSFDLVWHEGKMGPSGFRSSNSKFLRATHCPWEPRKFEDEEGRFTLTGLPPGEHFVAVEGEGYSKEVFPVNISRPGERIEGIRVVLKRTQTISGTVRWQDSLEPITDRFIQPMQFDREQNAIRAVPSRHVLKTGFYTIHGTSVRALDEKGRFAYDLSPGFYYLRVSPRPVFNEYHQFGPFELSGEKPLVDLTLDVAKPTGCVVVDVRDQEGRPIEGVPVSCGPVQGRLGGLKAVTGETDHRGRARLDKIRPGKRLVSARLKTDFSRTTLKQEVDVPATGEIVVRLDQPATEPGATISGRVLSDGKPVPGHAVSLRQFASDFDAKTRTDEEGLFSFTDLAAGLYFLRATHSDKIDVTIEGGCGTIERDLLLGSLVIEAELFFEDGPPPADQYYQEVMLRIESGREAGRSRSARTQGANQFRIDFLDEAKGILYAHSKPGRIRTLKHEEIKCHAALVRSVEPWKAGEREAVIVPMQKAGILQIDRSRRQIVCDPDIYFCLEEGKEIHLSHMLGRRSHTIGETIRTFYYSLVPGRYRVEFRRGWTREFESLFADVKSGETTTLVYKPECPPQEERQRR